MVNEVNKLIYNALAEHNSVVLPRVGTLSVVRRGAKMEGDRVVAPTYVVEFSSTEDGAMLIDIISSIANIPPAEAEDIYLRWLDKVREGNVLIISGVGTLRDKSFILSSELAKALNLSKSTPYKIHSRRRKPSLLVAAAVVVLLGAGAYLYMANDRVAPHAVESSEIVAQIETPESFVEEVIEEDIIAEPEPKRWIDNKDIRHWVVVGSYSTRENAERAVEDILDNQKAECCDILVLGKMYAVAVYGSSDKAECERYVSDNRHHFKQSWVHTPKRFK